MAAFQRTFALTLIRHTTLFPAIQGLSQRQIKGVFEVYFCFRGLLYKD